MKPWTFALQAEDSENPCQTWIGRMNQGFESLRLISVLICVSLVCKPRRGLQ
uniref:Uncharacterized protein n=1 Tax=Gorilla gorilla gorilla TaxID=9595 RepID=A0A2I2ZV94_GORGO